MKKSTNENHFSFIFSATVFHYYFSLNSIFISLSQFEMTSECRKTFPVFYPIKKEYKFFYLKFELFGSKEIFLFVFSTFLTGSGNFGISKDFFEGADPIPEDGRSSS